MLSTPRTVESWKYLSIIAIKGLKIFRSTATKNGEACKTREVIRLDNLTHK